MVIRRVRRIWRGFPPPAETATSCVELDVIKKVFPRLLNRWFGDDTVRILAQIVNDEV